MSEILGMLRKQERCWNFAVSGAGAGMAMNSSAKPGLFYVISPPAFFPFAFVHPTHSVRYTSSLDRGCFPLCLQSLEILGFDTKRAWVIWWR